MVTIVGKASNRDKQTETLAFEVKEGMKLVLASCEYLDPDIA